MNNFISLMPEYLQSSKIFTEMLRVKAKLYDELDYDIDDFNNQLFIDTATWGLEVWEREFGLEVNLNRDLEDRRNDVKTKMRGAGKVSASLLENILSEYYESDVKVDFDGNILFRFPLEGDSGTRLLHSYKIIEDTKPAHLPYDVNFKLRNTEGSFYLSSYNESGEDLTIYPWAPSEILIKPITYISIGYESLAEDITIHNIHSVNNL